MPSPHTLLRWAERPFVHVRLKAAATWRKCKEMFTDEGNQFMLFMLLCFMLIQVLIPWLAQHAAHGS